MCNTFVGKLSIIHSIMMKVKDNACTYVYMICEVIALTSKIPLYILLVGGVKGARYVLTEVLVSPILSDQFGFYEKETSYFFLSYSVGQVIGSFLV